MGGKTGVAARAEGPRRRTACKPNPAADPPNSPALERGHHEAPRCRAATVSDVNRPLASYYAAAPYIVTENTISSLRGGPGSGASSVPTFREKGYPAAAARAPANQAAWSGAPWAPAAASLGCAPFRSHGLTSLLSLLYSRTTGRQPWDRWPRATANSVGARRGYV